MINRRAMVAGGALALAGSSPFLRAASAAEKPPLPPGLPEGVYDTATLEALPGKKPLIKLSYRPPNYETPLSQFASEFTPNDSFFVRYHLSSIPEEIDAAGWKLKVGGEGIGEPLELSLSELRSSFDPVEIAAVCQCSGNRRSFSEAACRRRAMGTRRRGQCAVARGAAQGRARPRQRPSGDR
jgi:sulfite dehydrogenase (cytochrome) subunit A